MLMRNERLATLRTRYDDATDTLTIDARGPRGRARRPAHAGRPARDRGVLPPLHADELRGPPKVLTAPGPQLLGRRRQGRVDHQSGLGRGAGDARSARRSIRCASAPISMSRAGRPGTSSIWSASEIAIGDARLKVVKRIVRCAATNVDPDTGIRDLAIPATLMQTFDHMDCGIYARSSRAARSRRVTRHQSVNASGRATCFQRLALGRDAPAPHHGGRDQHQRGAEQIAAEHARARAGVDQRAEQHTARRRRRCRCRSHRRSRSRARGSPAERSRSP